MGLMHNFQSDDEIEFEKYSNKYRELTGNKYAGDNICDLKIIIESEINSGLTSMREHKGLNGLLSDLDNG